jgi:hypothetical protein
VLCTYKPEGFFRNIKRFFYITGILPLSEDGWRLIVWLSVGSFWTSCPRRGVSRVSLEFCFGVDLGLTGGSALVSPPERVSAMPSGSFAFLWRGRPLDPEEPHWLLVADWLVHMDAPLDSAKTDSVFFPCP